MGTPGEYQEAERAGVVGQQTEWPPVHLIPKISEVLDVTADELLGISAFKEADGARNSRLWRKLRQVEKLPPSDRRALLKMLDALLAQHGADAIKPTLSH